MCSSNCSSNFRVSVDFLLPPVARTIYLERKMVNEKKTQNSRIRFRDDIPTTTQVNNLHIETSCFSTNFLRQCF